MVNDFCEGTSLRHNLHSNCVFSLEFSETGKKPPVLASNEYREPEANVNKLEQREQTTPEEARNLLTGRNSPVSAAEDDVEEMSKDKVEANVGAVSLFLGSRMAGTRGDLTSVRGGISPSFSASSPALLPSGRFTKDLRPGIAANIRSKPDLFVVACTRLVASGSTSCSWCSLSSVPYVCNDWERARRSACPPVLMRCVRIRCVCFRVELADTGGENVHKAIAAGNWEFPVSPVLKMVFVKGLLKRQEKWTKLMTLFFGLSSFAFSTRSRIIFIQFTFLTKTWSSQIVFCIQNVHCMFNTKFYCKKITRNYTHNTAIFYHWHKW